MLNSRSSFSTTSRLAPSRIFRPGCALAAGLLLVAPTANAAPAQPARIAPAARAMSLRVGKTATYPLPERATYVVETGALNVLMENKNGALSLRALRPGLVRLRIQSPGQKAQIIALQLVDDASEATPTSQNFGGQTAALSTEIPPIELATETPEISRLASPQIVERAPIAGGAPQRAPLSPIPPINAAPKPATSAPAIPTPTASTRPAPAVPTPAPTAPTRNAPTPFELFSPDYNASTASSAPANAATATVVAPTLVAPTTSANPTTSVSASPTSEFPANILPPQNLPPEQRPPAITTPRVQLIPQTQTQVQQAAQNAGANAQTQAAQNRIPLLPAPPSVNSTSTRANNSATSNNAASANNAATSSASNGDADGGARISPSLPAPVSNYKPRVNYKTTPKLPASFNQLPAKQSVNVTQGEARLLTFQNNILSVFFSDPNVMDARAINARTIAVTGTGAGQSTLAVFTERYPGDAVGYASVYRVNTGARGNGAPVVAPDAATVEAALTTALSDPRVRVSVVKLPEGTLAARLTGIVRNDAEVQGAVTTASFFAPRVLPSVYADPNAPSIDAVLSGAVAQTPSDQLQDNLRRITGNPSIELISMPGSLVLKAQSESQEDAQRLLELLPTLNQPVIPFVTVRGGGRVESSNVPLLQGEDLQLTQKLQAVTGVRTVYAVRASGNSIAIYGTVQDRAQFQAVKRYGTIIAQSAAPAAQQGANQGGALLRPTGTEPALAAYDPTSGYARQLGVQMFVRIIDPTEATIRNVTIETNIVEITRNNLKNLGAEYGSATLNGETVTRGTVGTSTPQLDGNGNVIRDNNGNVLFNNTAATPDIVTRDVSAVFNAGTQVLGKGLSGLGNFGAVNPFRARVNAIAQNNNARVLASPNIRATEGTVAQITIGGERPVPAATASFGSNAQTIEFRRFGVILTMRPTVTDDNTIILQIRADVTQPDQTYAINVGGAVIPGESVRSIDTTLTVRPGDIVVMGGLLTNDKREQTSKVPILGDIPIIGSLFRSRRFENNETELAIFMSPRIDSLPATMDTNAILERIPSFPALPGRQETNAILQTNNTRQAG